jgi:hypothetical protein
MTLILALATAQMALAETRLVPILTGVPSPTFVGHAGDGSNRLFVLEQAGIVDVVQPTGGLSVFLDIRTKVLSGGERGLLGLAFHPLYSANGRFFVYYTRAGDGALTIAEYAVSRNPNVADPNETILLQIAHPINANHNGGMLAFGPGGYLYIGVGDGGSANDPPNNAQNIDVLLGKMLRIDVDRADLTAGTRYSVPPSNPFVGRPGRDEIFVYGLRNPWRFSFDRTGGLLWIADVGQNAREEVDTAVVAGANYGWRVYEGTSCTNNDPSLCSAGRYVAPLFDYGHSNGRCSITGGYVYRGSLGTFTFGTYVYGDYCSGEVFTWVAGTQSVLLNAGFNITSFGEDEQGEHYVVGANGVIAKLTGGCVTAVSPLTATVRSYDGATTISVRADTGCTWSADSDRSWITIAGPATGQGNGTITYTVKPLPGRASSRAGTITINNVPVSVRQVR